MQTDNINWRHLERMQHEWLARQAEQAELVKDHDRLEEELGEHLRQPMKPPEQLEEATTRAKSHKRRPTRPKRRAVACRAATRGYRVSLAVYHSGEVARFAFERTIDTISPLEARIAVEKMARAEGWLIAYILEHPTRVEIPA